MRFAMFDQLEHASAPVGEMYRDRLRLLEAADEAGVWCYFTAEHHLTPLDMSPSTSTWLGALAVRTTDIRLGSLVYALPFHHPLRLMAEITTLDHLSSGRLELGVGRGISPFEHALWGNDPNTTRECFEESLDVLLAALTNNTLTYHGEFWNFEDVPIEQHPLQQPYPSLWYPGNLDAAGTRGFNTIVAGPADVVARAVTHVRELAAQHLDTDDWINPGAMPSVGATVRIVLHADEKKAHNRGRVAFQHFHDNITKLWHKHGVTELPNSPSSGGDYDAALARNTTFAGTPAMLIDFISARAEVGIDPMMLAFDWGDLDASDARRSMDLFAEHVMPAFAHLAA